MYSQAIKDLFEVMNLKRIHNNYVMKELGKVGVKEIDINLNKLEEEVKNTVDIFKNEDMSVVYYKSRSIACEHCNNDVGCTVRLTRKCNRKCFFCFVIDDFEKESLPDVDKYMDEIRKKNANVMLKSIAISGGEPFLYKAELFELLKRIRAEFKNVYLRIYSNADFITIEDLEELKKFNVNEIRISIKPEEKVKEETLKLVHEFVPNVVIELPILPDALGEMKQMLMDLDKCDITGINLVEFFYNGFRPEEFKKRGYEIFVNNLEFRKVNSIMPPLEYPVYGSKRVAYELILFAAKKKLSFFVNICSNRTKNLQFQTKWKDYENRYISTFYRCYGENNEDFIDLTEKPKDCFGKTVFKLEYDSNLKFFSDLQIISHSEASLNKELLDVYNSKSYMQEEIWNTILAHYYK